jgi:EAL domain-containing protein (putative c-di-GMP-specific phosphodiesterase class I)
MMRQPSLQRSLNTGAKALEQDEFRLHYRPQFDLIERHVVGAETLFRWHHPVRGEVLRNALIPIAEGSGLIRIGEWVLL